MIIRETEYGGLVCKVVGICESKCIDRCTWIRQGFGEVVVLDVSSFPNI